MVGKVEVSSEVVEVELVQGAKVVTPIQRVSKSSPVETCSYLWCSDI